MTTAESKGFGKPDEVREFPKGRVELIQIGGATVGRAVFQPGWRWSTSLKPIAKTESCQAPHFGYLVSGVLGTRMDDGTEFEARAGDVALIPPGHDGWVVGDEPAVLIDFQGMVDYAKTLRTAPDRSSVRRPSASGERAPLTRTARQVRVAG